MTLKKHSRTMEEIAVSKFKATCLSVLERVRKTREPIPVTRFGIPIVQVIPFSVPKRQVVGDIVSPVVDERDWAVLCR